MSELRFECNEYRTVDENDLPVPDKYQDGLKGFRLIKECCDKMTKFNSDGDSEVKMGTYIYPDLLGTSGKPTLFIQIDYDGYESGSYDEQIPIQRCPWCQTLPTLTINKKKRIKTCGERIIPQETKQYCDIEVVPDN